MNQVFTKKKLAAALTLAFATGGAAVLAVAPVPGLVAAAQANQFAATTLAVAETSGVAVPKSASAALSGQNIVITEASPGALSDGNIILTPSAGKFKLGNPTAVTVSANGPTVEPISVDSNGNLLIPISASGTVAGTITIGNTANPIVLDTSGVSVGTAITVTVSTSSTVTGLTKGVSATIANVTAVGATTKATATTTPTYGKLGATTIVNTIDVSETILGSIKDSSSATDEITVTLPSGFNFVSGGATNGTDDLTTDDGAITNNVIKYNVSGAGTSSAGKVVLGNTNWVVYIPSSAADGNVDATVAVKLSDGTVSTSTVTLFKVASSGTTNSAYTTATTTAPTTYATLYAGRATQTTGLDVAVRENVGASLLPGGTVSLTFPTGVTAGKDYTATEVTVDGVGIPNAVASVTDAAGTASEDGKGSIMATLNATDAANSAGKVTFKLDDLDLADTAAVGDLNVTVGGSAGATAGTVKVGTVITATTTTPAAGPTITAGATLALPEIVMVENKAGALAVGAINLFIASANGVNLTGSSAKVKAYKADGTDISTTILGNSAGVTPTMSTPGVASFSIAAPSDTATGPVTLKINGISATTNSSALAGNVTAVIGGATATTDTAPSSNTGAKAFKQTITIGKIVGATVPSIPAATVTGATSSQTIDSSLVAAGNDQGKLGTLYVAAVLPASQGGGAYLKNSSGAWVAYNPAAPAYFASPVTLGSHTANVVTATDLSGIIGTNIYVGYGLGTTDFGVTAPWNQMLNSGNYNLVYTVK